MTDYIAFEGPAWAWILAIVGLLAIGGTCAGALVWALGLRIQLRRQAGYHDNAAKVDEVDAIALSLSKRITTLETAKRQAELAKLPKVWDVADEHTGSTAVSAAPVRT